VPNPVPFAVAPAVRQGTFKAPASPVTLPAGYSKLYWELDIPLTAEYEDPSNVIVSRMLVNGTDPASTWTGGHYVDKLGNVNPAPAVEFDIRAIPAGSTVQVQVEVNAGSPGKTMTVGVKNGLLS
jgi:hypothetical protein